MTDQVLKFPKAPREVVVSTDRPHAALREELGRLQEELGREQARVAKWTPEVRAAIAAEELDELLKRLVSRIQAIADLERAVVAAEGLARGVHPFDQEPES